MPDTFSRRARSFVLLGSLVPCLLISVPAVMAYSAQRQLEDSVGLVAHTHEVQRRLQRLLTALFDAETGCRGFYLTNHKSYLDSYYWAREHIPGDVEEIRSLTVDNSVQQENFRKLGPLVTRKLESMARGVELAIAGKREETFAHVATDQGKIAMDAIRVQIHEMDAEEEGLLSLRQADLETHSRFNTWLLLGIVGLNFVFVAGLLFAFRRIFKLQDLVTICAWSRTVQFEGEWVSFETYLQRRFKLNTSHGISPAEAEKIFDGWKEEDRKKEEEKVAGELRAGPGAWLKEDAMQSDR